MTPERWQQIEKIFQSALGLEQSQRKAFLEEACAGDEGLRREVESLLKFDQRGGSFIEAPALEVVTKMLAEDNPGSLIGHQLGSYQILSLLGAGGMGVVYQARDTRLKRLVALKILPREKMTDPERKKRFGQEARAASALNHPNIITIHDIGTENGLDFIVMEHVSGRTLDQRIPRKGMKLNEALKLAIQIAEALAKAHSAGIVHRDLKPSNVMVSDDSLVKVLDFGLAKLTEVGSGTEETLTRESLTEEGTIVGTVSYMSPEQAEGKKLDARSDIFSFGAVLYEMVTGEKAFQGDSKLAILSAILNQDPKRVIEINPALPRELDRIINHCLRKDPVRRFQHMDDVKVELEELKEESDTATPSTNQTPPRSIGRNFRQWLLISAIVISSVVGVVAWLSHLRDPNGPLEVNPFVFAGWWGRTPNRTGSEDMVIRRVTYDSGLTTSGAISTDGKLVAYASDRGNRDNLDIWVQQVDGGGLARLTEDPADDYDPSFSSDGTQIAFRSDRQQPGVYVIPALGGDARLVAPQGRRPQFSPDGRYLMYWTGPSMPADVRGALGVKVWVQPISGGAAIEIGAGCRKFQESLVWSPDSRRIMFIGICGTDVQALVHQPENYGLSAWVSSADGKNLSPNHELHSLWHSIHVGRPVIDQWIADPSRLLIPIAAGDATNIISVPVSVDGTRMAGPPRAMTFGSGNERHASASVNGRVALSVGTAKSSIWVVTLDGSGRVLRSPKEVASGSAPSLSQDGRRLAYISQRINGRRLFYQDLASGREKELSNEGYRYDTPAFNRDGTKIMCVQYPGAESWRNFVYEVPVSGGLSRKIWDKATFSWLHDWSPDGSTALLNCEDGMWTLCSLDLNSLEKTSYIADEAHRIKFAQFSHTGKWVAFSVVPKTSDSTVPGKGELHSRIFLASFRQGLVPSSEWVRVTDGESDVQGRFSPDDKLIYYLSERDGFRCIWAQRLDSRMHPGGHPFAVYHAHGRESLFGSEFAAGPGTIVFNRVEQTGNIWVLEPKMSQ